MCTEFEFRTLKDLEELFEDAIKDNSNYMAIIIKTEGYQDAEIIINSRVNFDKKLEYYKRAYNDDLTLKSFNGIKIVAGICADSLCEIEECLCEGVE